MANKSLVIPIPINLTGMTGTANLATVSPDESLDARNLTYYYGTTRKEGGTSQYGTLPGATEVRGGWDWWPTPGTQRMVCLGANGSLYKDTGAGTFGTVLTAGLNMSGTVIPVFVECGKETISANRLLAVFTGTNPVQVLSGDGAVTAAITNPPTDWSGTTQPITGCVAQNRLWGFMGDLGYYSNSNNHQSFQSAANDTTGTIAIFPGEGEFIRACCAFKGLILIWKEPMGLYYLDVTSPVPFDWTPHRLSPNIGIDSPRALAVTDNDVAFTWNGVPYLVSAVLEFGNIKNADLSVAHALRPWIANNTNSSQHDYIQAIYYADRREFHWGFSGAGNNANNYRLVMDFNKPGEARFRYSDLVGARSLWMRKDSNLILRPMAGDTSGVVRNLDIEARSVDGATGYMSRVQTPHDDFQRMANPYLGTYGIATRRKNGQWLEVVMEPKGDWNLYADIYWDAVYRQTLAYNMGVTGAALDSFVLDTDALAGDSVANKKHRIVGSGKRFSAAFYNSGAGQDFSLAAAFLGVTLGGDRPGTTE